jgi:DNA repair exonuclease SbcCD ATPase subunit
LVRIEIENFKPYTKVELPNGDADFSELPKGLFVIHGSNSMGKTSFIQGMLWGLLGEGLMKDQTKKSLVKAGESSCNVDITFDVGTTQYNIIRKLIAKRSRTSGDEIDFNEDAVLSEKNKTSDTNFITIINRPRPVNNEVEQMLGVSADLIEKTVYIRQKEVDRLALANPKQLRELIMSLFGLDEFERVKNDLMKKSCDLQDTIDVLRDEVGGLNTEKRELISKNDELKKREKEIEEANYNLKTVEDELSELPSENILTGIKETEARLSDRSNELALVEASIREKGNYLSNQIERIESLRRAIDELEDKKDNAKRTLESLPPKKNLHKLNELVTSIQTYENQIIMLLKRSNVTLDFNPILDTDQVKERLVRVSSEVESLSMHNDEVHDTVEYLRQILTSTEVLSGIKKSSIQYIEEQEKCPVCNKLIDNKEEMVVEIDREITDIERNYNDAKSQLDRAISDYTETERKIETGNVMKVLLENLVSFTDDLASRRGMLQSILHQYSVQSIEAFLSLIGFSSIEKAIEQITRVGAETAYLENSIQAQQEQIRKENEQYKSYEEQLSQNNKQKQDIVGSISQLTTQMRDTLLELSSTRLDELLSGFQCNTIDELIIKRKILENIITDRQKPLDMMKMQILSLSDDIRNREANIAKLSQREELMLKKENELRHVKYLRGEIDGFISNYVVEGKMVGLLRQATNPYLTQLTEDRYTIDNISSTMRRVGGGMESHGLEITLMDSMDNMIKNKEQLSGGDETALGLALRIAISKLMARIKPFKNSEKRPPIINSIIMDEPMASLDSNRRRILLNILTQDKSFNQIFLVTHTDIEFGDYHSIQVDEDGYGKRRINYKPIQL